MSNLTKEQQILAANRAMRWKEKYANDPYRSEVANRYEEQFLKKVDRPKKFRDPGMGAAIGIAIGGLIAILIWSLIFIIIGSI